MTITVTLNSDNDAPTNPIFSDTGITALNKIFTAIATDGESTFTISHYGTEQSNLANTKGFRIKCYDALTGDGTRFNPTDFGTFHYFVLVYSDTARKHHFARITQWENIGEDEDGDVFEFEPRIGNEIPKDTKFQIVKGHAKTNTNIVAVSGSIFHDTTGGTGGSLGQNLICARPLFYFFNDSLDKPNELNHNTKYYAMQKYAVSPNTLTFDTTDAITFRTVQDFGKVILDYSKYTHRVTMTDVLRDIDADITGLVTTNENKSISVDTSDYNACYPNARRIEDDLTTTPIYTGPQRYLHYDYSPTKSNLLYNVYQHYNTESIAGKGGFAETTVIDNARVMPKKVQEFYAYRVRHNIHTGELNDFFTLKAKYQSKSGFVWTFDTEYDLEDVLNDNDEIKIGDYIFLIEDFGSLSGTTQTITVQNDGSNPYARTEDESSFTAQALTPSVDASLLRRAYNATDGTLMIDTHLIDSRFSKLYVAFTSLNHNDRFASVTACDATKGMLTLSLSDDSYNSNPLTFSNGQYSLFVERFNGEVENLESKKMQGQTVFEIKGRDKFVKLLSPVINQNMLFSEDIVYSSNSPYNKLALMNNTNYTLALGSSNLDTGMESSSFTNEPAVGDHLFTANGYLGKVTSKGTHGSNYVRLTFLGLTETALNSEKVYVQSEKNYVFNKALSSSHLANTMPTSLTGSANKGVIFTSGMKLVGATNAEDYTDALVSSSANTTENAIGYAVNSPSSVSNEFAFQAKLHDEHGSASAASFDTVNTLMDFEVVEVTSKDNITEIELALYLPMTLGRKIPNFGNDSDYTLTEVATVEETGATPLNDTNPNIIETTTDGIKALNRNDPVFIGGDTNNAKFAGFVRTMRIKRDTVDQSFLLYLDRDFSCDDGDKIYSVSKDSHDLFFINGAHLWGGKILSMPHPKIDGGITNLNIENIYNSGYDTNAKYGQPLYKTLSLSKGNFNYLRYSPSAASSLRQTYTNLSKLKYNSIAYRFTPNYPSNSVNVYDKTGTGDDIHMDIELRGYDSAYGSVFSGQSRLRNNIADSNKFTDSFTSNVFDLDEFYASLSQKDTSAATLFLYLNADFLPYSSTRADSLMNNKNIINYNLFLLENKNIKDKTLEFTETSSGNQIKLNDSSFQTISITENVDISALKRFGLMRLTELCFDIHFNPFNPEKPLVKNSAYATAEGYNAYTFTAIGTIDVTETLANSTDLIFLDTETVAPSAGNKIYDANYKFIGTVLSYTSSTKKIVLNANAILNDDGTFTSGTLYRQDTVYPVDITGAKDKNTFLNAGRMHIQKGAVISAGYQEGSTDAWAHNNNDLVLSFGTNDSIVAPMRFTYSTNADKLETTVRISPSRVIYQIFGSSTNMFDRLPVVILDTFTIEDGGKYEIEKGVTVDINDSRIDTFNDTTDSKYTDMIVLKSDAGTFTKKYPETDDSADNSASVVTSPPYPASGARIAFKPRFWFDASEHTVDTTVTSSNGTIYHYGIDAYSERMAWIDMVDLTGCYLVSEKGSDTLLQNTVTTGTEETEDARNMEGVIPDDLIYVISHTVPNTGGLSHDLILDKALTDETAYRVLKPNETAFYDFSPNQITLNMLSSRYTKMANEDKMYEVNQDIEIIDGTKGRTTTADGTRREAFLSMYVAVDPDKQSVDEDFLVMRQAKNFLHVLEEGSHSLHASDGDNSLKLDVSVAVDHEFTSEKEVILTMSDMKELDGIVNFAETFTLKCVEELKIDPTRACIGSTVDIGLEGEDIINELLEQEDIEFSTTSSSYPVYLAPNYQGVDLYSAIQYVLNNKEMKLVEENDVFKIVPDDNSDYYTNITIDDSADYLISDFEKTATLFDFYNEIVVYGISHKSVKKDIRSIQKRGRKTLEIVDNTLRSQSEVDNEATKLLKLHSKLNETIKFRMQNKGINQLRPGDIVNVSIPRENIEMSQFIILQMEHEITGFITLELGRFSKDISDLFSELIISSKDTKSALRSSNLVSNEVSYNFFDSTQAKELKLLVRKREASAGQTLGFSNEFGFASELGFTFGSEITITNLVEEDLA